jgi:Tfp pilus assembly protein PilE
MDKCVLNKKSGFGLIEVVLGIMMSVLFVSDVVYFSQIIWIKRKELRKKQNELQECANDMEEMIARDEVKKGDRILVENYGIGLIKITYVINEKRKVELIKEL